MITEKIPVAPVQKAVNRQEDKEKASKKIISRYTMLSTGAALVPINFVDVISGTAFQTLMVKDLCNLYNVNFSEKLANVATWSAVGTVVTKAIQSVVSAMIDRRNANQRKDIDITGAAVAGIYTATVGEFYKLHLREGGTLDTIEISDFADYFIQEVKSGDLNMATFTNPSVLMKHLNFG
ncbi:MAG: DUF697 domain-containing protein [Saprospiraceae bacterium]